MNASRISWIIAAITFVIFLPAVILNDFVTLDDTLLITHNAAVHGFSIENLRTIFTTYDPELYVPLTLLTYQIEYSIAGLTPQVFHITNLVLHCISALLVFTIIRIITLAAETHESPLRNDGVIFATFIALIFAVHPLQTEAVVWAAARKDLLSGMLVLLSLWSFLRYRDDEGAGWYVLSIATFGLALLAKVSVLLLPFSLLMLDGMQGKGMRRGKEFLPFLFLALLFGMIALFGKTSQVRELALLEQGLIAMKALGFYVLKFFVPFGLSVYQPQLEPLGLRSMEIWSALIAVTVLVIVALRERRRYPLVAFGWIFFLAAVAPSFLNVWKNGVVYFASDRYVYLGMIGLALGFGSLLIPMLQRVSAQMQLTLAALIVIILGSLTFVQSTHWRDSVALYTRALGIHPEFAVAASNLGSSLYEEGKTEEAMQQYQHAIALDPTLTPAHINIGLLKRRSGDLSGALAAFEEAVAVIPPTRPLLPEEVSAFSFLGTLLDELGRSQDALNAFAMAAIRAPEHPDAHYNYAVTLQKYREFPKAREELISYVRLRPRDIEARYRLAAIEAEMGLLEEAAANLAIVVDRDPEYEQASKHLQNIRRLLEQ